MNTLNKYFPLSKKIPIDKFIANALYDKDYGYYSKKIPFGKNGDFITSPGISPLFSEMIALWIVAFWEYLDKPKIFNIVEINLLTKLENDRNFRISQVHNKWKLNLSFG